MPELTDALANKTRLWKVVAASSAGTLIESYDFYIFGSLATILSAKFLPRGVELTDLQ